MSGLLIFWFLFSSPTSPSVTAKSLLKKCKNDFTATYLLDGMGKNISSCLRAKSFFTQHKVLKAMALLRTGRFKQGLAVISSVLKSPKASPLLRVTAAQLYWHLGEKDKFGGLLDRVIDDYKRGYIGKQPWDITAAGIAATLKRDWETAETIFVKIDKHYGSFVPGLIAAGEYDRLIEFHQRSKRLLKRAVALAPHFPDALTAYGRVLFENPYGEKTGKAGELALEALAINKNWHEANLLLAMIALYDLGYAEVQKNLKAVDRRFTDHPLAMTLRAGVALLRDKGAEFGRIEKAILAKYPLYFSHYYQLGRILNRHHRYRLAGREFKKGLKIAPDNVPLLAWLGLSLLRIGDEGKGYYYIKKAAELNEDHVMAYNVMTLYQDIIFPKYLTVRQGPFLYRVPKSEWPVMKILVPPVLEAAYERYKKHYGFTPPLPIRIEFFKDKKDFTVLIAGHPVESGILGVCFGQVISFLSPSSGHANWAMVISHELAHTFHVEMTKGKVPRWFTEGLAEFETANANYYWKREMSRRIHTALVHKMLKPVSLVNRSFSHARSSLEMVTAYIYSTWLIRFLYLKSGWIGIKKALTAFKNGSSTPQAILTATGLTASGFDDAFLIYLRNALYAYRGQFSPDALGFYTVEDLKKMVKERRPSADCMMAAKLQLKYGSQMTQDFAQKCKKHSPASPWLQYSEVITKLRSRDSEGAITLLLGMIAGKGDGFFARSLLATLYQRKGESDKAIRQYHIANRMDPEDLSVLRQIAAYYNTKKDEAETLFWLKKYARYAESDASASLKIVEIAWKRKDYATVSEFGSLLIQTDPFNAGVYNFRTAYSLIKSGHSREALSPLLVYQTLHPSDRLGKTRFLLAKAFVGNRRYKQARKILSSLVSLFPGMSEASSLLKEIAGK
ncbi:hypothetical protein KKF84_18725 [Myxococcota bacterium]|nr:hypothetical protein [Myxococcota bacterium]